MQSTDEDWFIRQAISSASRLAATPSSLLGPAGRQLREFAITHKGPRLKFDLIQGNSKSGPQSGDEVQPPLMLDM